MLTNIGLVRHVKRALKERWGYIRGTFGDYLTESLLQYKIEQYGDKVSKYLDFIKENYLNKKRVADCVGLVKSYIWWNDELDNPVYDAKYDVNETQMFNLATKKGTIDTIPEIEGVCVWKTGHMGLYIGDGQIIEEKGTKYGIVQTPLKGSDSSNFTHWFCCPFIEYIERDDDMFKDIQGHYAEKQIEAVAKAGIMVGDGKGNFNPNENLTRGQLAIVLCKIFNLEGKEKE